jgi:hypothetical protein
MGNLTLAEIAEALYGRRDEKGVTISVHPSETRLGNASASTYSSRRRPLSRRRACPPILIGIEIRPSHAKELTMITKTVAAPAQPKATPPVTTLPPELLVAVDAVNQRVRDCVRLDAALDACGPERLRLTGEHAETSAKLASIEADLALADRGSNVEVAALAASDQLTIVLSSIEREHKRTDARELALEAQGEPLDEKLAQAVTDLRREMNIFIATLCEAIAQEYRAVLPPLLVARARLNALATLDPSARDSLWDSHLIDPTSRYQHLLLDGPRRRLYADEDMLAREHPDATIAGEALASLLKPVLQALAAGRRQPFRSLRERRIATSYEGTRGYEIRTGRPDAVPAAPPKPPVPSIEEQMRTYQVKSDSSGARSSEPYVVNLNIGSQLLENSMKDR